MRATSLPRKVFSPRPSHKAAPHAIAPHIDIARQEQQAAGMSSQPTHPPSLPGWKLPPWPIFNLVQKVTRVVDKLPQQVLPPPVAICESLTGVARAQALMVLVKLGVPDCLASQPMTAAQLALRTGADPDRLLRLLRFAASLGYVQALPAEHASLQALRFQTTPYLRALQSDAPDSLAPLVMLQSDLYFVWEDLLDAVRRPSSSADTPIRNKFDKSFYQWLESNPSLAANFSQTMARLDVKGLPGMLEDYNWGQYSRFLDLGGALGSVCAALLRKHPSTTAVLYELPEVIDRARAHWAMPTNGLALLQPRLNFCSGSFLIPGSVPPARDGDVYLFRSVLFNWADEDVVRILKNVRAAIGDAKAKVCICENQPKIEDTVSSWMDLLMMQLMGARGRGPSELAPLLLEAGFAVTGNHHTRGEFSVIEAVPV